MRNDTFEFLPNDDNFLLVHRWETELQYFELWKSRWSSTYDKLIVKDKDIQKN